MLTFAICMKHNAEADGNSINLVFVHKLMVILDEEKSESFLVFILWGTCFMTIHFLGYFSLDQRDWPTDVICLAKDCPFVIQLNISQTLSSVGVDTSVARLNALFLLKLFNLCLSQEWQKKNQLPLIWRDASLDVVRDLRVCTALCTQSSSSCSFGVG